MCRLMALTFTDKKLQRVKADILDRMLLMSQTDENQNDGWGVTDGITLTKDRAMYSASLPSWKTSLDPSLAWMAHIRKASTTTGRTNNESHPYQFNFDNGESLFAAHNGFIHGTSWNIDKKVQVNGIAPNTDSWRAFAQLYLDMLEMEEMDGGANFIPPLIENWTPNFEDNSQFAMLFHWRGGIVALRHDRPLHLMEFGNGHIIHTSLEFLRILRENLKWQYNVTAGDPKYIDKDNMIIFQPESHDLTIHKLDLRFKPRTVYTQGAWQGHGASNQGNVQQPQTTGSTSPSVSSNESGSNESGKNEIVATRVDVYSKPVTRPRPRQPIAPDDKEDSQKSGTKPTIYLPDGSAYVKEPAQTPYVTDMMMPTKIAQWRGILNSFIPLRSGLCTFWAVSSLGYRGVKPGEFIKHTTIADLRLFQGMVGKMPVFTPRQNMLINAWNHMVNRGVDWELHSLWCDQAFFWMNPRYNRTNEDDYQAVSRFQCDLVAFVEHALDSDDLSAYLRFSKEKLERIIESGMLLKTIRVTASD